MSRRSRSKPKAAPANLVKSDDSIPQGWREISASTFASVGGRAEIEPTAEGVIGEYERSLWVYSAVSAKARFCAGLPWTLKRRRKGKDEVIGDHDVITLLEHPAPGVTWNDFIEACVTYLELAGRLPIEKARDGEGGEGPVRQLYPLQPHRMKVIVKDRGITRFVYSPDIVPQKYEPKDICYITYFDPLREFGGVGGMTPGWVSNLLDRNAREWNARFFKNGAHPDGIVSSDMQIPKAIRERLEREFMSRHQGTRKGRGVEVLEHGMKFQEVGISHREIQFDRMMKMSRVEIHAAFGVPPILSGLMEDVNYATSTGQLSIFRDHRCIPLMMKILGALTWSVVDEFDPDLYLEVDRVRAKLYEERQAEYAMAQGAMQSGIVTRDEAREMVGREPMKEEARAVTIFAYDLENGVVTIDEAREAKGLGPHPNREIGVLTVPEARIKLGWATMGAGGGSGSGAPMPRVPGAPELPKGPEEPALGGGEPAAKAAPGGEKGGNGHPRRRRIHPADIEPGSEAEAIQFRRP